MIFFFHYRRKGVVRSYMCTETKASQYRTKPTIITFPKIIYQWKWEGTCKINILPPTIIITSLFTSDSLVLFEKRQVFLVKHGKWAPIPELTSPLLLCCSGAFGRSFSLSEHQFLFLWKEQIPSVLANWEGGKEISPVTEEMLWSSN